MAYHFTASRVSGDGNVVFPDQIIIDDDETDNTILSSEEDEEEYDI